MRSTIDAAGRIVVPKVLRERLGLAGGTVVDIRERDGRLEIEPVPTPMALAKRRGTRVAVPARKLPPLTDEIVRVTIDCVRRR
jgi:AbrB family looped-hinge helix DNA binding protein